MIRFVDYRKNLLKSSAQRSNVLAGVDRYFEILRLDLIEATKFPRSLSEEFLGDASVMLDRLSSLTNEVHKYIVNEDVNAFKKVFHRYILETAAAASPPNLAAILAGGPGTLTGDAAEQLKAKLIWAIKQFIEEIKKEVAKQVAALSATATSAASTPASATTQPPVSSKAPPAPQQSPPSSAPSSAPADSLGGSHLEDPEDEAPGGHRPGVSSPYHHRTGIYQPYPSMPATGGRWKKSTSDPNNNWFGGIGNMFKSVGQWFKDKLHRGWHGANLADSVRRRLVNLVESTTNDTLDALIKTIDEFGKQIIGYIEKNADEYITSLKSGAATAQPAVASNAPSSDPNVLQGRTPGAAASAPVDASKAAPPPAAQAPIPSDQRAGAPESAVHTFKGQASIDKVTQKFLKGEPVSELELQRLAATFNKDWDIGKEPVMADGKPVLDKEGKPKMQSKSGRWLKIYNSYLAHLRSKGVAGVPADSTEYKRAVPVPKALTAKAIEELRSLVVDKDKPVGVALLDHMSKQKGEAGTKRYNAAKRHFGGAKDSSELYDRIIETKAVPAEELSTNGYKPPVANAAAAAAKPGEQPPTAAAAAAAKPGEQPPAQAGGSLDKAKAALLGAGGGGGSKGPEQGETAAQKQEREARELAAKLLGKAAPAPAPKEEKPAPAPAAQAPAAQQPPAAKTEKPVPAPAAQAPAAQQPPAAKTGQQPPPPKEEKPAPAPAAAAKAGEQPPPPKEEKPAPAPTAQPAAAWTAPAGVDEANLDVDSLMILLNPDDPDSDEAASGFGKLKDVSSHVMGTLDKVDKVLPGFKDCCPGFSDDALINQVIQKVYPEVKAKCGNKFDGRDPATMEALKKAMLEENIRAGKVEYIKKNSVTDTAKLDADVATAAGLAPPPGSESKKASGVEQPGAAGSAQPTPAQPKRTEEEIKQRQQDITVEKAYAVIPEDKKKLKTPEEWKAKIRKMVLADWDREDFQKMKSDQLYQILAHLAVHENVSPIVMQLGSLAEIHEGLQSIRGAKLNGPASEDPMKKLETFLAKKKIRDFKHEFPDGWEDMMGFGDEERIVSRYAQGLLDSMASGAAYPEAIKGLRNQLQQAQQSVEQKAREEEELEKAINAPPPPEVTELPDSLDDEQRGPKDEDDLAVIKAADAAMRETEEEKEIKAALTGKQFEDGNVTYMDFLTRKAYGGNKDLLFDRITELLTLNKNDKVAALAELIKQADELKAKLGDEAFDWMPKKQVVAVKPEDEVKTQLKQKAFEHGMTAAPGEKLSHDKVNYLEFLKKKKFAGNDAKLNAHILDILLRKGGDIAATLAELSSEAEQLKTQLGAEAFNDIVTSAPIPQEDPEAAAPEVEDEEEEEEEEEEELPEESDECKDCTGSGACPKCKGSGTAPCKKCKGKGVNKKNEECDECMGSGLNQDGVECKFCRGDMLCQTCGGSGRIGEKIDVDELDDDDDFDPTDDEERKARDAEALLRSRDDARTDDDEYERYQQSTVCTYCKGSGADPKDYNNDCPACEGDGTMAKQDELRRTRGFTTHTDPYYKKKS